MLRPHTCMHAACCVCLFRVDAKPPWENLEVDLLLAMTRPKVLERILQVKPVDSTAAAAAADAAVVVEARGAGGVHASIHAYL